MDKYSIQTSKDENTVKELSEIVLGSIDVSKVKDDNYINNYEKELCGIIKSLASSNEGIVWLYLNFDPKFTIGTKSFDVTYTYDESKKEGIVETNVYTLNDYRQDNQDLDWYHAPIKAKKGVWSKIYVDSVSKINMISYTMPIYYNNELVGVAGLEKFAYRDIVKRLMFIGSWDAIDCHVYKENGFTTDTHCAFSFIIFGNDDFTNPGLPDIINRNR